MQNDVVLVGLTVVVIVAITEPWIDKFWKLEDWIDKIWKLEDWIDKTES